MGAFKRIVVGSDGSDTSLVAVDRAAAIAADGDAELLVVAAYEPARRAQVEVAADVLGAESFQVVGSAPAEEALRVAAARAKDAGVQRLETRAVQGAPVDVLDTVVREADADLVVVGNVGLNTLAGRVLGSVPRGVVRRADIDVLIVHTS
ncbi:universal stress protein [Pseudonocardia spinosispora]|uniref:universal stress protein n=1 Tax=Pseudonocardia spinosispora TaxID=103441 RepID=UPI000416D33D|nr:universal stress protein [Pseudonocardia spinosispora]